jgi:carbohydrate-binding DOMON domain-containing protein
MTTSMNSQTALAAGAQAINARVQATKQVLGWNGRGEALVALPDGSLWIGARLLSSPLFRAALVAQRELAVFAAAWDAQAVQVAQHPVASACDAEADDLDAFALAWDAQAAALGHPDIDISELAEGW